MADIELVIKIPEDIYKDIVENGFIYDEDNEIVTDVIKNGIPLPKGHGRLIDADALIHWHRFESKSDYDIANAPTIIEADKAERSE